MDKNKNDFCSEYFARQWIEETTKFKKLTSKKVEKAFGIWKPMDEWREKYEKRKQRERLG